MRRLSTSEPSESQDDQHSFCLQPCEDAWEATVQSLEQDAEDLDHAKAPSPSESNRHVSFFEIFSCAWYPPQ
jgi:hypothetical protein